MVIEKALEVRPDDRYQSAEDFERELLNARSASKRRGPVDYNLAPPGAETHAKAAANGTGAALPVAVDNAVASDSSPLPMQVSTPIEEPAPRPALNQSRARGLGCWIWLLFAGLVLSIVGGLFIVQPSLMRQLFSFIPIAQVSPTQAKPTSTRQPAAVLSTSTLAPSPTHTATLENTLTPTPGLTITPTLLPTETFAPAPTPLGGGGGQIAFASNRSGTAQIWMINVDGSNLVQITDIPEGACQPSWAPDGMRLVFVSPCQKQKEFYLGSSLYMINIDGTGLTLLPSDPGGDYDPVWSPDGRYIAFTSLRGDYRPKVFLMDLESNNEVMLLASEGSKNMQPAWSFDGKKIAFATTRRGPQQIWIMNVDGSEPEIFTRSASLRNANPSWSPGGSVLIFTQDSPGDSLPWLSTAALGAEDTRGLRLYPDRGAPMREPKYSPDGQWIVMEAWVFGENHDLFTMLFNGSSLTRLTEERSWEFDPVWRPVVEPVNSNQ
jgi:Tol biopolymer transport system component